MKHRTKAGLIAALSLACFPSFVAAETKDDEVSLLKAQVAALSARLSELEAREQHTSIQVENLDQTVQNVASSAAPANSAEWADRINLKGDLRYRHDAENEDGSSDRNRQRIRARLGLEAVVTDDVITYLHLATGGSDPRSTNQTLGDGFSSKSVAFDLAYFQWAVTERANILGGKMKNPIRTPKGNRFIDPDITPEGLAATWTNGDFFLLGSGFWAAERSSDDDTIAVILQGGYSTELDNGMGVTAAVSYTDWSNLKGYTPFDQPFGNSVSPIDGTLLNEYQIVEAYSELTTAINDLPLRLWGEYGVNTEASSEDTAFGLGVMLGKTSAPGSWEVGYSYHDHERDALFAQVVDSDFAGGQTDARGHVLSGGYALAKNVTLNLSYFLNEIDISTPDKRDYQRLMLDLNFKY